MADVKRDVDHKAIAQARKAEEEQQALIAKQARQVEADRRRKQEQLEEQKRVLAQQVEAKRRQKEQRKLYVGTCMRPVGPVCASLLRSGRSTVAHA